MRLLLIFIAVPLIEIALFIQVGDAIGLWPTLGTVVLTAVIGSALVRQQGLYTLSKIQNSLQNMAGVGEQLAHGMLIFISGVLLLTPGFFTDFIGFLLLMPAVRRFVVSYILARIAANDIQMNVYTDGNSAQDDVFDAEYEDITKSPSPSGWTKPQGYRIKPPKNS